MGQQPAGPHQPARRDSPPDRLHVARRQGATGCNEKTAVLFVRPRGWHLPEKHVLIDGAADLAAASSTSRSTSSTTRRSSLARGSGPYFYLPKLESHLEARLWNDIFVHGAGRARRAARLDPRDGADRDAARGVRDGRDPLRAARALGGTQLRALGLHLLVHQEAAEQPRLLPRRPRARHDDDALHEELRACCSSRPATAATSTRWAAWRRRSR